MPITFAIASHKAEPVKDTFRYDTLSLSAGIHPRGLLSTACPAQYNLTKPGGLHGTSFSDPKLPSGDEEAVVFDEPVKNVIPKSNGFFHALSESYNQHHALILRPDDVWLAILTQFNFFVNANAELLRASFVDHEGTKRLVVTRGALYDYGELARAMVGEIEKNVVDPHLREWALPSFTTTTENDTTVASILLMATLKSYFESVLRRVACGIPRVTLEGEKADWEQLLQRVEKLKEYTVETIAWYHLLVPVLSRFVKAFDEPEADSNVDFWQKVAHYRRGGSGASTYTGWISAFCVFNNLGQWSGPRLKRNVDSTIPPSSLSAKEFWATYAEHTNPNDGDLVLDDTRYASVNGQKVPPCYAAVDVLLVDSNTGKKVETSMTAGIIGVKVLSSGDLELSEKGENDVVKPVAGWWLFDKQK
ncbi:hypothetical protein C8F01DRAFT_1230348 [Mycena amicta]|nr:hypothetical protein C8F01DRAFT_1230348 [Mycena amicta]